MDISQRHVSARQRQPLARNEPVAVFTEEWGLIPEKRHKKLKRSLHTHVREVIRARGGHTHF